MKNVCLVGGFLLLTSGVQALQCYDLSSDEAASILDNELAVLQDDTARWEVKDVGWGLSCLNYCPAGDFEVAKVVAQGNLCTYTIKNLAPEDVVGESTTITLKAG